MAVLGSFEDEEAIYVVQEYCARGDLFAALHKSGGCMAETWVACQVCIPTHNHQVVACRTSVHNVAAACLKLGWFVRSDKACPHVHAMLLYNQVGRTSP